MKKAQVTMFMIFGIILLFLIMFILYGVSAKKPEIKSASSSPVENYIKNCIKDTAGYGLYLLGIHGGRIYDINDAFVNDYFSISYAIPSLDESKKDLEKYIDENLNTGAYSCINDLRIFSDQYDRIEVGPVSSDVIFADEVTLVKVNMSVSLKKAESAKKYGSFDHKADVRYKKIHDLIIFATNPQNKERLDISTDFLVKINQFYDENTNLYTITDKKSKLNNKNYIFLTAVNDTRINNVCYS